MSVENNYFFVDGSSLLADVSAARKIFDIDPTHRLNINQFVSYFGHAHFRDYHGGYFRRFVFYFVKNDDRIACELNLPDPTQPSEVGDIHIQYCGKKVLQTKRALDWLDANSAPQYVTDRLHRSEKAVDTQICCDALQLAGSGHIDRLFLYTNDYDFTPLCKTLRQLGANINLFRLRKEKVNKALVEECDAFHVMRDKEIRGCFS